MLHFFNSKFATISVNIIVILAFLLFIYFILKKYLPTISGEKLKDKIKTSTTSQNVFAFISVVVASTFLDLFSSGKFHMLWSVAVISILTILFNFLYEKVVNKNNELDKKEEYKRGLNLIEQIIGCKGYTLIKRADELKTIEDKADEIYIFTENLVTDIPHEYLDEKLENSGLFADIVSENLPKGKKNIYFLKDTEENRSYQKKYNMYHFQGDNAKYNMNASFYYIPENEFCFFSEIYLYKDTKTHDKSFEWIPSIGEKNNPDKQFYLELSSLQTQNINEIICELMVSCNKFQLSEIKNEF